MTKEKNNSSLIALLITIIMIALSCLIVEVTDTITDSIKDSRNQTIEMAEQLAYCDEANIMLKKANEKLEKKNSRIVQELSYQLDYAMHLFPHLQEDDFSLEFIPNLNH